MIVVDASVLADALVRDGARGKQARAELGRDAHWAAPEHVIVETFSSVRGLLLGKRISERRARDSMTDLADLVIELLDTRLLLSRMWALRANLTGYDAAYVAAAEAHGCPLVTADGRLARARGLRCEVRLSTSAG